MSHCTERYRSEKISPMVKSRRRDLRTIWDASLDRGVEDPLEGTVWDVYCQYGEPEPETGGDPEGHRGGGGLSPSDSRGGIG